MPKLHSDLLTPFSQQLQGECLIPLDRVLVWLADVTTLQLHSTKTPRYFFFLGSKSYSTKHSLKEEY